MSRPDWPPASPGPFSQDSLHAAPWPPAPRRTGFWKWIVTTAVIGLLGLIGCGGLGLYFGADWAVGSAPVPADAAPSQADKYRETREAFESAQGNLADGDFEKIRDLFDTIEAIAERGDTNAFRELVDARRQMGIAHQAGWLDGASFSEKFLVKQQMEQFESLQSEFVSCRIVHVRQLSDPEWVIAYTSCAHPEGSQAEFRWTLAFDGRSWRIADIERVDLGMSDAQQAVLLGRHFNEPGWYAYIAAADDIERAQEEQAAGRPESAARRLQRAEQALTLPQLQDLKNLFVAYQWRSIGREAEAMQCLRKITHPESLPGYFSAVGFAELAAGRPRRAIESLAKYAELVGPSLTETSERAKLLVQTGRPAEALVCWRQLVALAPDAVARDAMVQLLRHAPAAELEPICNLIERAESPRELTMQLADAVDVSREAAVQALRAFAAQRFPDSVIGSLLDARQAEHEQDYATAADHYRWILGRLTEQDSRYSLHLDAYLWAMLLDDRAVEGYEQAPNHELAFSSLLDLYREGDGEVQDEDFLKICQSHLPRSLDPPACRAALGSVLLSLKQYTEAERELRAAREATSDDDLLDTIEYDLSATLFYLGRTLEAYHKIQTQDPHFGQLVNLCQRTLRLDEWRQLNEAHSKTHSHEAMLYLSEARLLRALKRPDGALAKLAQARQTPDAETYAWLIDQQTLAIRLAGGQWREAHQELINGEQSLGQLAAYLQDRKRWSELDELLRMHRARYPDAATSDYELDALWQRQDYETFVRRVDSASQPGDDEDENDVAEREARVVTALLRLGRGDEAQQRADRARARFENPFPLALVHVTAGRAEKVAELASELETQGGFGELYDREDTGPKMFSEPFAELRRQHPPRLDPGAETVVVWLLAAPAELSQNEIEARLKPLIGPTGQVAPLQPATARFQNPRRRDVPATAYLVTAPTGKLVVSYGTGSYGQQADWSSIGDPRLAEAVEQHSAWVAVDVVGLGYRRRAEATTLAYRAARDLAGPDAAVLVFERTNQALLNSPEAIALLGQDSVDPDRVEGVEDVYLEQPEFEPTAAQERESRAVARRFRESLSRQPSQPLEIEVRIGARVTFERLRIAVSEVDDSPTRYGRFYVGTLVDGSHLIEEYRPGSPVLVPEYSIESYGAP